MTSEGRVLQPHDILRVLGVKHQEEGERILNSVLSVLLYLKPGDVLEISSAKFHKIGEDLLQIEQRVNPDQVAEALQSRRVIKLPV